MIQINLNNLRKGDVLLAHNSKKQHTAIYLGNGQIVHASIGEKGTTGNRQGDQTKREILVTAYYSAPWDCVLRYKDASVASVAADWAVAIANDDSHGYDQINRWGPDFDCSSLVISAFDSQGVPVKKNGCTYTGNMRPGFLNSGFVEIDPSSSSSTTTVICSVALPELQKGSKGEAVKALQNLLILRGFNCGAVDGSFGNKTRQSVLDFQQAHYLSQDACVGKKTWQALIG